MLLRSMRKGVFSAIFLGFLVLGGLGLVLTDWNGMFRGGNISTDVAKIEGAPIKLTEFDRIARRVLQAQNIPADKAYEMGLIDNILQSELLNRALTISAAENGIAVEDRQVARRIQVLISPLKKDGSDSKEALAGFLQMQGMSEPELVSALRGEMSTTILRQTVGSAVYIPEILAQTISSYMGQKRNVKYVEIKNESVTSVNKPSTEEIASYYDGIKGLYTVPESRDLTLAVLSLDALQKDVAVSDEEVKAYYDENLEGFRIPEKRLVEQAILGDEAQAKKVAEKMGKGISLKKAVETVTGKTTAYTGETSFEKEGLMKEIADPIFAAKEGDILPPIQTAMGWQVLVLKKVEASEVPSLEKISAKIKEELTQNKTGDVVYGKVSEIEDRIAGGETLEDLAKEYGLTLTKISGAQAKAKSLPEADTLKEEDAKKLLASAFATADGEISSMTDISGNRMAAVRIDQVSPAHSKDLKDVETEITMRWIAERKAQANLIAAQKIVDDLDAKKTTLEGVASTANTKIVERELSRDEDALPKDIDPIIAARFLDADQGDVLMVPTKDSVVIGFVVSISAVQDISADEKKKKSEKVKEDLTAAMQQENLMSFATYLQNKYDVTTNLALLKRYYGTNAQDQ
jgi:peptidyl-prolyl cis-trans isomerase D